MDTHLNLSDKPVLVSSLIHLVSENILISCLSDGTKQVVPVTDNFSIKVI